MSVRRLPLPQPLDLRATLSAMRTRSEGFVPMSADHGWWMGHTPDGPVTIEITVDRGCGEVAAEAWGPGAGWSLDGLDRLVGAHDRPDDFVPRHPIMGELLKRRPGLRIGATRRVWDVLLPTILGQKVTGAEAGWSYRRLRERYGEPAPGPIDERLAPRPEVVAQLGYEDLHPLGVERKRAQVIIEAARRIGRLEAILDLDRDQAQRRLGAIRGIGPWTIGFVMGIAWGDPDAVPVGDYHLPNLVAWVLTGEDRADDARMLELLEPYRGRRRHALLLIKSSGTHAPRYGPRLAPRSFSRH